MKTTTDEAKALLVRAIAAVPDLTYFGVGIGDGYRVRREKGREFVRQETARLQAELFTHLDEIATCADWLKHLEPIKGITPGLHSYGHKHRVEGWTEANGERQYIANGSFIAAAIGLGFTYRIIVGTPNVAFGFSKRSLRELERSVRAAA